MTSFATETVALQQLAWGKLAVAADGALVGGPQNQEHRLLGTSPDFPRALVDYCHPGRLGVAQSQNDAAAERLFEQISYGTGLQLVVLDDASYTVFYRAGVRSEAGEHRPRARRYMLAHYLVDSSGSAPPSLMLNAMRPLVGVTGHDARELSALVTPLPTPGAPMPALDDAIVEGALEHVMSGVPVHLSLPETQFFAYADRIWRLLPRELRAHFSAGWNVATAVGATRTMSCCQRPPRSCADFVDGAWREPAEILAGGNASVLAAGRFYVAYCLPSPSRRVDALVENIAQAPRAPRFARSAARQSDPAMPAFTDPAVADRFRAAAISFAGDGVLRKLGAWLEGGAEPLDDVVPALVAHLTKPGDLRQFVEMLYAAWDDDARRPRADLAARHAMDTAGLSELMTAGDLRWSARARLIAALHGKDDDSTLRALANAGAAREAAGLAPITVAAIEGALDRRLQGSALHRELLTHVQHLPMYQAWLRRRAFDLVLDCAGRGEPHDRRCVTQARAWCASQPADTTPPGVFAVRSVLAAQSPGDADRADVEKLSPADAERFAALLQRLLSQSSDVNVRAVITEWAALPAVPVAPLGPVLQASRGIVLTTRALEAVATQPDVHRLPASAIAALSDQVLSKIAELRRSIVRAPSIWASVLLPWPADLRAILAGPGAVSAMAGAETTAGAQTMGALETMSGTEVSRAFRPDAALLRDLIDEWTSMSDPAHVDLLPRVAPRLWRWCAESAPLVESTPDESPLAESSLAESPLTKSPPDAAPADDKAAARIVLDLHAFDICHGLARGRLPAYRPSGADTQAPSAPIERALLLARLSGAYAPLTEQVQALWRSADDAWQMRLLMELFPSVALRPSADQLERLLPSRRWLRQHLTRADLHPMRAEEFAIAQYDFAELTIESDGQAGRAGRNGRIGQTGQTEQAAANARLFQYWRSSVFRGAFADGFRASSKAYAGDGSAEELAQRAAHAIEAYGVTPRGIVHCALLALQDPQASYSELVTQITTRFLLEWARPAGIDARELVAICEGMSQPAKARHEHITLDARDGALPFTRASDGVVVVAHFITPLIWKLAAVDQLAQLKSLVQRTSASRSFFYR